MALTEQDIEFEGNSVHFWEGGSGFPILMLHGSGPGAGTMGNWRFVLEPLAESYHVLATDLIGFGESGRKHEEPYFDIGLWRRQQQRPHIPLALLGVVFVNALMLAWTALGTLR